jgi:hypothetical protein
MLTMCVSETEGGPVIGAEKRESEELSGVHPNVEFQIITLFVWICAVALLIPGVRHWREGHYDLSYLAMPVLHLGPWFIAVVERKRVQRLSGTVGPREILRIQKTIARLSGSGYWILAVFEYLVYHPIAH